MPESSASGVERYAGWCAWHAFGVDVFADRATFAAVPGAGRAGWFIDTERWRDCGNVRFRVIASSEGSTADRTGGAAILWRATRGRDAAGHVDDGVGGP